MKFEVIVENADASIPALSRFAGTNSERAAAAFPILERIGTAVAERACIEILEKTTDYRVWEQFAKKLITLRSPAAISPVLTHAAANTRSFDRLFLGNDVPGIEEFLLRNLPRRGEFSPLPPEVPAQQLAAVPQLELRNLIYQHVLYSDLNYMVQHYHHFKVPDCHQKHR